MNLNLNPFENISDPFGIVDFGKDQYAANRDFGHAREVQDVGNRFTEYMSNTSYQRAVKDMEAAGLNPMLAYQQGGASSPGSASAPAFSRSNSSSGSLHSAAAIKNLEAQTALTKAQEANVRAEHGGKVAESGRLAYELENLVPKRIQSAGLDLQIKETEAYVATVKRDFLSGEGSGVRNKESLRNKQDRVEKVRALLFKHFEAEYQNLPVDVRKSMLEASLRELDIEYYLPKIVGKAAIGAAGAIGLGRVFGKFSQVGKRMSTASRYGGLGGKGAPYGKSIAGTKGRPISDADYRKEIRKGNF